MADYPPDYYLEHDRARQLELVRKQPLATFIVAKGGIPFATPLPLVLSQDEKTLIGHLDANNPAAALIRDGQPALAIFHGPSTYISPTDYRHRHLPTYNYMQVHIRGQLRRIRDEAIIKSDLIRLVGAMEPEGKWALHPDDERVPALLPHIAAFHLDILDMSGRFKLSQDKRPEDRAAAWNKLNRS